MASVYRKQIITLSIDDAREAIARWVSDRGLDGEFDMDPDTVTVRTGNGIETADFVVTISSPEEWT